MKIKDVISALECFAPLPLQESYDNAGLQVGLTEAEVSGALLCLDVTEDIVTEALSKGCNLIVSHHPLIFRKLKRVSDGDYVQRCVMMAIKNDITIVSMHTNLDATIGGVNYKMAEKLGLQNVHMTNAQQMNEAQYGACVMGELPYAMEAKDFVSLVKKTFHAGCVVTNPLISRKIKSVAMVGGAGADFVDEAIAAGADAFITGEMRYHEYFGLEEQIQVAVIGHYESERYTSELLGEVINKECPGVRCFIAETETNPLRYF